MEALVIREGLVIPAADLSFRAVRAQGPGGQNVNKVASRVELLFDLDATASLSLAAKERLRALAARFLTSDGALCVGSQLTRDQGRNLEDARVKLAELVRLALHRPKVRRATKPSRGAKERRISDKKKTGEKKAQRRSPSD